MRIARELIDADADKVVRRLARHGYKAYLVGGCVRDLLLSRTPKDFDVATSATPNEIKQLFRNCRIIGRRFRLAHVFFGDKIIETSTFRANPRRDESESEEELLIRRDNVFGSVTEDAHRRDFTINGLFYDVEAEEVIDHVGGLADLNARVIRTIGDPDIRFREDPVRMLRAVKFAARLDFDIETATYQSILRHRAEIRKCAPPRILEEVYRLLRGGAARSSMELLIETGLAAMLSPHLASLFTLDHDRRSSEAPPSTGSRSGPPPGQRDRAAEEALWAAAWTDAGSAEPAAPAGEFDLEELTSTPADRRRAAWRILDELDAHALVEGTQMSNAMLLAAVCAPFVIDGLTSGGVRPSEASDLILEVLAPLVRQLRIARRDAERARQVLLAQRRLGPARRRRGKPAALIRRDYFEEALCVYELHTRATRHYDADLDYWRKLRHVDSEVASDDDDGDQASKRRRRRRGGRRRRRSGDEHGLEILDGEADSAVG
jgi:poly(A) polymerase